MEYYLSLILFCFSSSITPGPNNLMMLMSGINFGVKKSLPHYFGILSGFSAMVFLVGMGLAGVFARFPVLHQIIKYLGAVYMLYLAYQIIRSTSLKQVRAAQRPLTFFKAVLFQWVNPKAWVMAIGAVSAFTVINLPMAYQVMVISLIYMVVGIPCVAFWLFGGVAVRRYINNPLHLRIFNITMGILLILSILLMLFGE